MSRNLYQRLERLEQQSIPEDESKVWEIIDSDGTATPSGIRIEWPTPGSGHCHRGGHGAATMAAKPVPLFTKIKVNP